MFVAISYMKNLKVLDMNLLFELKDCINLLGDAIDGLEQLERLEIIG